MSSCRDMLRVYFFLLCFVFLKDCDNSVIIFALSLQFPPVCLCTCELRQRATVRCVVSWAEVSSGEIERLALESTHSGRCQDFVKSFPWLLPCIIHQHNFLTFPPKALCVVFFCTGAATIQEFACAAFTDISHCSAFSAWGTLGGVGHFIKAGDASPVFFYTFRHDNMLPPLPHNHS